MDESNSCFICANDIIVIGNKANTRGHSQKKFENNVVLKDLLKCLSKLLAVPSNSNDKDWDFLGDLKRQQEICCQKCYNLLKDVDRVYQVLITTQKLLSKYLDLVETLIVKSEDRQILHSSLWSLSCFQLRRSVLNKTCRSRNDPTEIHVKVECGLEHGDAENEILEDEFDVHDDDWNRVDDLVDEDRGTNVPVLKSEASETEIVQRTRHTRAAKKSAEKALKGYSSKDSNIQLEDDGDEDSNNDQFDEADAADSRASSSSDSEASDSDSNKNVKRKSQQPNKGSSGDKTRKGRHIKRSTVEDDDNEPSKPKRSKKPDHFPVVVIVHDESLYLYRSSTFIRKTFTHLKCQAYECNFETEWDYYSSFQVMKMHIEEEHLNEEIPHPCILCDNKILETPQEFKKHIKKTHSQHFGSRNCRIICECCLKITSLFHSRAHRFTHKNEAELQAAHAANQVPSAFVASQRADFVCDFAECGKNFQSKKSLERHKQIHLPPEQRTDLMQCPECGKQILKESLNKHLKRVHFPEMADNYFVCEYCDKKYLTSDKANYEGHLRRHRGEKPFRCQQCDASFPSNQSLAGHRINVHRQEEKDPTPCEFCGKVYENKKKLRVHLRIRHREQITVNPTTSKASKFYGNQKKPEKVELGDRPHVCDFDGCESSFKSKKHLDRHKQTHLPLELRTDQTVCPECGKQMQEETLPKHMRSMHLAPESLDNVLVCPICDKRYLSRNKSIYEAHLRRHRGEKPFLCPECGKSFYDGIALHGHMSQVHNPSLDPIQCQYCDQVYTKKLTLRRHMQRKHPDKVTKNPSTRKMSKFYYNEEEEEKKKVFIGPIQKYPCSICEMICTYRFTLKKHMGRAHGIGENLDDRRVKHRKPKQGLNPRRRHRNRANSGQNAIKTEEQQELDNEISSSIESSDNTNEHFRLQQHHSNFSAPGSSFMNL